MAKKRTKTEVSVPIKADEVLPSSFPSNTSIDADIAWVDKAHVEAANAWGICAIAIGHRILGIEKKLQVAGRGAANWKAKFQHVKEEQVNRYMQLGRIYRTQIAPIMGLATGQKLALLSIEEMIAVGAEAVEENADPNARLKDAMLYKTAAVAVKQAATKREAAAKAVIKAKEKAALPAKPSTKAKRAAKVEEAEEELEEQDEGVAKADSELKKIPVKYKAKPVQNRWSIPKIDDQAYALIGLRVERDCVFAAPYVAYALGLTASPGGQIKLEKDMLKKLLVKLADVHKKEKAGQDTHDKREACRAYFAGE